MEIMTMKEKETKKGFIDAEEYKDKFRELLDKRQFMLIMVCNNLVLRIERMNILCKLYQNLIDEYCNNPIYQQSDYSMYYDDFLIAEEIIYHARKAIDEMIYSLWIHKVGIENIDDTQDKSIDSIGRYLGQNEKILTEFDDYLSFFDDINKISNSYKHSICMFTPLETDISNNKGKPSFLSYTIKERDVDKKIMQDDLLKMIEMIFNKFLECI